MSPSSLPQDRHAHFNLVVTVHHFGARGDFKFPASAGLLVIFNLDWKMWLSISWTTQFTIAIMWQSLCVGDTRWFSSRCKCVCCWSHVVTVVKWDYLRTSSRLFSLSEGRERDSSPKLFLSTIGLTASSTGHKVYTHYSLSSWSLQETTEQLPWIGRGVQHVCVDCITSPCSCIKFSVRRTQNAVESYVLKRMFTFTARVTVR
jgi:hypothetical protein